MKTTTLTNMVTGQTKTVERLVNGSWAICEPGGMLILGSARSAAKYVRCLLAQNKGTWAATDGG